MVRHRADKVLQQLKDDRVVVNCKNFHRRYSILLVALVLPTKEQSERLTTILGRKKAILWQVANNTVLSQSFRLAEERPSLDTIMLRGPRTA